MTDENVTNKMCEERSGNILRSLEELHEKIDNLDSTVRNGLSSEVTSNNAHIKMQWYFLGAIIIGLLAVAGRIVYAAVG